MFILWRLYTKIVVSTGVTVHTSIAGSKDDAIQADSSSILGRRTGRDHSGRGVSCPQFSRNEGPSIVQRQNAESQSNRYEITAVRGQGASTDWISARFEVVVWNRGGLDGVPATGTARSGMTARSDAMHLANAFHYVRPSSALSSPTARDVLRFRGSEATWGMRIENKNSQAGHELGNAAEASRDRAMTTIQAEK